MTRRARLRERAEPASALSTGAYSTTKCGSLGDDAHGAHARVALDQRLDAAVRQLEELEHPGAHPDRTQVLERGVLDGRLALRRTG